MTQASKAKTSFICQRVVLCEKLLQKRRPFLHRLLIATVLSTLGLSLISFAHHQTHFYFSSITIFTVILISLVGGLYLSLFFATLVTLLADYFFIPPLGVILKNATEQEHFLVNFSVAFFASLLVATLRQSLMHAHQAKLELEQAKQESEKAKQAADAANVAKSVFLANMSHEIRTPLVGIIGFADLIEDPHISAAERASYISIIKRNSEHLSNLINDILDLSKVEAGKLEMKLQETALSEILSDVKAALELKAKEKGITFQISTESKAAKTIHTDPLRLKQILINVIGNAIKFTSEGSVDVFVKAAHYNKNKNQLSFVIRDTGRGMDKNQLGRLFMPFSQIHAEDAQKYGGTGLGLSLSKHLAKLLGGDLVLTDTELGKGSTFTLTIDPGAINEHAFEFERAHPAPPDATYCLEGIKILLAEDSIDNQLLIGRILELAGAKIDIASNGEEALQKAQSGEFGVLLMDLQMPIMDGYEATAELRKQGYKGKIIALTAHAMVDERGKCLQAGFDDYITKPINRNHLINEIKSMSASP